MSFTLARALDPTSQPHCLAVVITLFLNFAKTLVRAELWRHHCNGRENLFSQPGIKRSKWVEKASDHTQTYMKSSLDGLMHYGLKRTDLRMALTNVETAYKLYMYETLCVRQFFRRLLLSKK